jgi:hypothetical protein
MPFFTLAGLYEKAGSSPRGRVLCLIQDATAPYRKGLNKKFILKVKVIDRSLCEGSTSPCPKKYCTIFFFEKNINDLPKIRSVGDVLLLEK